MTNTDKDAYNYIRRQDRAVTDEDWIEAYLLTAAYGTLAISHDGQPFVNSNLFVYDRQRHAIYFHTARVGRTRSIIENHSEACFSVSDIGRLLPADVALEFSVEYSGVTAFGDCHVVADEVEAEYGLQLLLDKYAPHLRPGRDYRSITPQELRRTAVFRMDIKLWSGKRKAVEETFPGAYRFEDLSDDLLYEREREQFLVSSDRTKLDLELIHNYLANEGYWSAGISREKVRKQIAHSLPFGLYDLSEGARKQIGFARVITDYTALAHLADVFVVKPYQGQGLGSWLVGSILAHPELQGMREWSLNTRDAQAFYQRFGFVISQKPENSMVLGQADSRN